MFSLKETFALQSIRNKVLAAFLLGCIVTGLAWTTARLVFRETFRTIDAITAPNPKLNIVNALFQSIQRLDQVQKLQVLNIRKAKPDTSFLSESKKTTRLLDSLQIYCSNDSLQLQRIQRMKGILIERDALFLGYLKFRYSILKNNPLSKGIQELSDYVSENIKKGDTAVVRTTQKSITTTTVLAAEQPKKTEKKESFFRRMFGRKKTKEEEATPPPQKLVTENTQVTIDTLAVQQRDSFMNDMQKVIAGIEKDRNTRRSRIFDHEVRLASANSVFTNELEQLLRQVQNEEIMSMQANTESLGSVFNQSFNWILVILAIFLVTTLVLLFMIFSDISRSNRMRLQLIEAKEKAEFLEQTKQRFLANMSHEIRTPLQSILGYSEQVKEQERPDKKSLDIIYKSSEHLLQIVNEVLDYSRIESGKFVIESQVFNPTELVAEVADIMGAQAENKNLHFRFTCHIPKEALYLGDPFRLKQILYNLLGNAIKFTSEGEIQFEIRTKEMNASTTAFTFLVKDTGIGMSAEELRKIFNPFEQAEKSTQRKFGGTGLGLSIVKSLTELQGGTVKAESEKGKGSSFSIVLNYKKPEVVHEEIADLPASDFTYHGKVMVIDDDAFILQLCSSILNKYNIPHFSFSSPADALAAMSDKTISLVFIDIRMPLIDGTEMYRQLKPLAGAQTIFVALTAQALPNEKASLLALGFDRLLLKPFREQDFIGLVQNTAQTQLVQKGDHFSLSVIKEMSDGDEGLFKKNISVLATEWQKDLEALKSAAEKSDAAAIAFACHRLAAKAGHVGLFAFSGQLKKVEAGVKENSNTIPGKKTLEQFVIKGEEMLEKIKQHSAE